MFFTDTDIFVRDRIQNFRDQADAYRRAKNARQPRPARPQSPIVVRLVRFAQVALMLGR